MPHTQKADTERERIARAILDHARAHYSEGWDTVYECHSVSELAAINADENLDTYADALAWWTETVAIRAEVRADVMGLADTDTNEHPRNY